VHPVAWWLWGLGLAVVAMRTTNPLVLALVVGVAGWVVASRRTDAPWARSFSLALRVGAFIIVLRVVLAMAFGLRVPGTVLFTLPSAELPAWMAGVNVGGPVTVELLARAAVEGLRLATVIACFGAANALANPYRLLRSLPAVLYEMGVALTVSLAIVPQTVLAAGRVREARRLRGRAVRGLRGLRGLAMPVLEGALERSVDLAASMDARGYGRRRHVSRRATAAAGAALATGLVGVGVGVYAVADVGAPGALGLPVLAVGSALLALGMVVSGRRVERSRYRPDPWRGAEWAVVALGALAAVAAVFVSVTDPSALTMPLDPLGWPAAPPAVVAALAAAALAGVVTPPPVPSGSGLAIAHDPGRRHRANEMPVVPVPAGEVVG
jgi:energy-coupling factor transport system permease protein